MTSGQMVTTTTQHVECDGMVTQRFPYFTTGPKFELTWDCMFTGYVDIVTDPETVTAGWECPACRTWHDIAWDDLTEPDPDKHRDDDD